MVRQIIVVEVTHGLGSGYTYLMVVCVFLNGRKPLTTLTQKQLLFFLNYVVSNIEMLPQSLNLVSITAYNIPNLVLLAFHFNGRGN